MTPLTAKIILNFKMLQGDGTFEGLAGETVSL